MNIDKFNLAIEYGTSFEAMKWTKEIPFIDFPRHWAVKITPNSVGSVVRFRVKHKQRMSEPQDISVYLDCYDMLGYYGEPYWEVYPCDGDTWRVAMNDTKGLVEAINRSLKQQKMKHAHYLKPNGTNEFKYPKNGDYYTLPELQNYVGELIQIVIPDHKDFQDYRLVINEEGKIFGSKYNKLATGIYGNKNDFIVGNVLFVHKSQLR